MGEFENVLGVEWVGKTGDFIKIVLRVGNILTVG